MDIKKEFQVESKTENINEINNFLTQAMEEDNIPFDASYAVEVSFEEIFVNICNYAYGNKKGLIDVTVEVDPKIVKITFVDSGIPFDPLAKEDPDVQASIEDRPIGGLGIFMVKKMVDEFIYHYKDGKNINILIKKLD